MPAVFPTILSFPVVSVVSRHFLSFPVVSRHFLSCTVVFCRFPVTTYGRHGPCLNNGTAAINWIRMLQLDESYDE